MSKVFPTLDYEKKYWAEGLQVIGVDEVGRGCLAGPVVAGAVIINPNHTVIEGLTDSKQLSAKQRTLFSEQIKTHCQKFSLGIATVEEINTLGIVPATFLAMERALLQFKKVQAVLVDGSLTPRFLALQPHTVQTIIKGDQLSYSIAAASIIAKVYRDVIMQELHKEFPQFAWDENKGYGTKKHQEGLLEHGLTVHHRSLFCRNAVANKDKLEER